MESKEATKPPHISGTLSCGNRGIDSRVMATSQPVKFPVNDADIAGILLCLSIDLVYKNNSILWEIAAGERAIVSQVFFELKSLVTLLLPNWDVDCEYNRIGERNSPKPVQGGNGTPDIVVHHRSKLGSEHNLLVAEFKRRWPRDETDRHDSGKVTYWINEIGYQMGACINLSVGSSSYQPSITWYTRHSNPAVGD